MSARWRIWWKMCFMEKTDSSILMVSPILERLTLFRVRFPFLNTSVQSPGLVVKLILQLCGMVVDADIAFSTLLWSVKMQILSLKLWPAGSGREAGLLPRALASLFRKLQGRLYGAMDLKPVMYQDVRHLDSGEVRVEEIRRNSLLKEVNRTHFKGCVKLKM